MQAQAVKSKQSQDTLTAQQSLQSVQTLLRAGLGCITYLRNLLPEDNFSASALAPASGDSIGSQSSSGHGPFASGGSKRNSSGFRIMTITRGYTEEADKLLDYLEKGIFDALEKQYLRSFIFAVYLDDDDPNNIVEAYTFNFRYYTIPGSDTVVPVMSLGDDLQKMSLSDGMTHPKSDPVSDAMKKGRAPTLDEVKRSLKTLTRNLIQVTTQMDALPRRRFATFKLFYHDHTPDDYEPPYFRAGDSKKDKWFFTTHNQGEAPEKCSIGEVQTGWHAVNVHIASVTSYLPSSDDSNAPFHGASTGASAPALTPVEEAALRAKQTEAQRQDAGERCVVWAAEDPSNDVDAEGSEDDGDAAAVWRVTSDGLEFVGPIGLRDNEGNIVPLPDADDSAAKQSPPDSVEAIYNGVQEKIPRHLGQLRLPATNSGDVTQTQRANQTQMVEYTQEESPPNVVPSSPLSSPSPPTPPRGVRVTRLGNKKSHPDSSLPPSDPIITSGSSMEQESIDTQMLKDLVLARRAAPDEDTEMLDMETQIQPYHNDSIESFTVKYGLNQSRSLSVSQMQKSVEEKDEIMISCECGVTTDDCDCIGCDKCDRWFHTWCMGYHSSQSDNIPQHFICYDCRLRAEVDWDLIMANGSYSQMLEKFSELAIFRRAIKICELDCPENLSAFAKLIDCGSMVAGQIFKRLESEGFIALETEEVDDLGLMQTTAQQNKNKSKRKGKKQGTQRRTMRKAVYVFVRSIVKTRAYRDYFDPDNEAVNKRLLALPGTNQMQKTVSDEDVDMVSKCTDGANELSNGDAISQDASQTQAETQAYLDLRNDNSHLKRKDCHVSSQAGHKVKRTKTSIGPAVDLGD